MYFSGPEICFNKFWSSASSVKSANFFCNVMGKVIPAGLGLLIKLVKVKQVG